MGDKEYFFETCQNEFSFLKEEFACLDEKKLNSSWGKRFSNNNRTTGIILTLEWREVNVFA